MSPAQRDGGSCQPCLKSGNATILRGGVEALDSNMAIARCLHMGWSMRVCPAARSGVATADRAAVGQLITMPEYVDVIVPRGGKGLIERISQRRQGSGDQAPGRNLPCLY